MCIIIDYRHRSSTATGMAAGKAMVVVFFVLTVAMAIPCYEDCMGHCLLVRHAPIDGCAEECDQACRSLGLPGGPPRTSPAPAPSRSEGRWKA